MKKSVKALLTVVCCLILVAASILGTLAYMTDREEVVNTFTVGKVAITLDETDVNPDGTAKAPLARDKENDYHLIPGRKYIKDPTMTVIANSEECYVRMMLTVNEITGLNAAFDTFEPKDLLDINSAWTLKSSVPDTQNDSITYEYRYTSSIEFANKDTKLTPLFTTLTVPGTVTGEQLAAVADLKISVEGHAIQAEGFANEDAAWTAFDDQYMSAPNP